MCPADHTGNFECGTTALLNNLNSYKKTLGVSHPLLSLFAHSLLLATRGLKSAKIGQAE